MKKLIAMLFASVMFASHAMSDIAIGVSLTAADLETSGSETELTGDLEKTTKSHDESVVIPEVFIEAVGDNGFALGVSYIPARDLGSGSRTDTSGAADVASEADTGTYSVDAELTALVSLYTNIPIGPVYALLGVQRAEINITDNKNDGTSNYEDATVMGYTVGAGYRGSIGDAFYKAEVSYTDFDEYSDTSSSNDKKVQADTEVTSFKFSMGMAF